MQLSLGRNIRLFGTNTNKIAGQKTFSSVSFSSSAAASTKNQQQQTHNKIIINPEQVFMMNTDFSSSSGTTSVEKHIRMPSSGGPSFSGQFDAMFNPENGGKGFPKTPQHLIQFIRQVPTGKFIMQRRVVSRDLAELNNRLLSEEKSGLGALSKVQVMAQGSIGDELGTLEADFANMVIGGGSMDYGCVQEEIKFSICPEMNVSRLYCEVMEDNEAIVLIGGEQFAKHKGYAFSLQYDGDYVDTRKDESGNITVQTVAIDAIRFVGSMNQFESGMINRELLKAFAGFYEPSAEAPKTRISTGNWGCGAFNGDKQLKFVIQWIAASLCQRDLVYYTFDKGPLASEIQHFIDSVNGVTVQEMYAALMKLSWICAQNNIQPPDTFNHLLTILGKKGELNTATRCTIQ